MSAVNSLPPADFNGPTAFNGPEGLSGPGLDGPVFGPATGSATAAGPQIAAGSAPESPFGDVLSHSIGSTSNPAPQSTSAHSTSTQSANVYSAGAQPDNMQSGSPDSGNTPVGPSQPTAPQRGAAQSSTTAAPSGDTRKPAAQASDDTASPAADNAVPTSQASILAGYFSGVVHAVSEQPAPSDPADASNSKAVKSPQGPAPGAGAAPAQLLDNLLQPEGANGNDSGTVTAGGSQKTATTNGVATGNVNAPQALIAGLQQATNQRLDPSKQKPDGPAAGATPDTAAGRNPAPGEDKTALLSSAEQGTALPDAQPAPVAAESTGPAADPANLVTLTPTSNASSTAVSSETALDGKASGPIPANAAGAIVLPPPAALSTTAADVSGLSQMPFPAGPIPPTAVPAGQLVTGQQPGSASLIANSFAENVTRQSAGIESGSAGSLPALAQLSTPVLPSASATSSTSPLDVSSPVQPATDAGQPAQQQGSQNPGYLYGTAPPSLQLQVMNVGAGQTGLSGPLTSPLTSLVLDQAAYAVQYSHASGQQMQLHLNPPELGALQVNVSMHNGVLTARIEAQTATTQQILSDNISQLKDSLTQQGVSFDHIDVHLSGSNAGSTGSGTADKSFAQQQDGGLPWDQPFLQPENNDSGQRAPALMVRNSRAPLTTLDIMA